MPRLIDADNVEFALTAIRDMESGVPLVMAEWLAGVVSNAPTIDAVPVVRCKDCKHNEDCIRRIQFWGRNPVLELNTTEYHPIEFCSYGERKDNE